MSDPVQIDVDQQNQQRHGIPHMGTTALREHSAPAALQMERGGVALEARNLDVCRKGKKILDNVSFTVRPGTLTAIIGPNGAGKTTLMRALSGERPDQGQVLINGEEIYNNPEYWLQRIGYVPVDNVLHPNLSVYEALLFIGKLRLPDLPLEKIEEKIDLLLTQFYFPPSDSRRHRLIGNLSSGERKRANICAELLNEPPLLLLDEPTSNLDPDAERDLMRRLAEYAEDYGQTILVITHTLNTIDVCKDVIFIENARLTAFGEQEAVLAQLEQRVIAANGAALEPVGGKNSDFYRWARIFKHFQNKEEQRKSCSGAAIPVRKSYVRAARRVTTTPWLMQLRYLLHRYSRVRFGDFRSLMMTLGAGVSGALFFILPGQTFIKPYDLSEVALALNQARQSVYVVAMVVTLLGLITSYTEISKEFRIYRHERLKGLSPSAYFMSKWIWLTLSVGILAPIVLMFFIVLVYRQPLPDFPPIRYGTELGWWEQLVRVQITGLFNAQASWLILITLILTCIASVTLGLLISAISGDSDRGYLYLSFASVFIVLFSGLIRNEQLEEIVNTLSFLSTGRWAYEGFAASINVYCWLDAWFFDEFNSAGHIASVWLALGFYSFLCAALAVVVLRMRDPWYTGTGNFAHLITQNWRSVLLTMAILALLFSYTSFLRQQSYNYHTLNYFNEQRYGGDNSYEYGHISKIQNPTFLQLWNGKISQSWCTDRF